MIEAHFDPQNSWKTAIGGVYQYDTGQRLRLRGLPAPQEMAGRDEFISGSEVMVQAQFANEGDSQTEMRLALWNDDLGAWLADVPDEYLTRVDPVHVYVYVYHGETEEGARARTMYEGVFTPMGRPAPSNIATPEQWAAWATIEGEVELALVSAQDATENAENAITSPNDSEQNMSELREETKTAEANVRGALKDLLAVGKVWEDTTISKVDLAPGSEPTVRMTSAGGMRHIEIGIPIGADGANGEAGDVGPADVTIELLGKTITTTTT